MKKMIKLISMVCLVAMLVGMLPVLGVSAADTATLELETAFDSVKAGGEFTIDVNLANNPGIQASVFELNYDVNKFEYVGFEAGTLFGTTLVAVPTGTTNIVRFVISSGGVNNVTDNGKIASVTFKAKEDVQVGGTYTFTTTVNAEGTINGSKQQVALADASKTVTFVDANTSLTTIDGAQVNLGTDISVTYKVTLDPDHAGAQMKFTTHGKEYYADPVETAEACVYEYTLKNIAPQCMGDNIKAEVIFGGVAVATKETYSILENCNNLKDAYPGNEKMADLIDDLLVYGAAAQKYQNYKTNDLVTEATAPVIENDPDSTYIEESGDDVAKITSLGVKFDYTNALYIKFVAPEDTSESNFMINVYNDAETINTEYYIGDCGEAVDGIYTIYSPNVSVLDYGETIYIDMYVGGMKARNIVQALEYTVNDYCYRMQQNSSNPAMVELAQALYYYGQSASAYAGN